MLRVEEASIFVVAVNSNDKCYKGLGLLTV